MPDTHLADLPSTKKSKDDSVNGMATEQQQQVDMGEKDRRKRVREILKVINRRLIEKDMYRICHSPPCSLLYPNYPFDRHLDMSIVSQRVDQLCYFNIAQYRAAVNQVVKCQTTFFPSNTIRHEFAFRFEQFARKQTTYRALVNLCKELEIKDELSKKEMRDILVGTDMSTERKTIDAPLGGATPEVDSAGLVSTLISTSSQPPELAMLPELLADAKFPRRQGDNFTTLPIASGAFNEAHINGKPVTLGDITGRVIGAPTLPKKTRTIEDKAYTISYLKCGPFGSFGPEYDSRAATVHKEDSDLLFQTCCTPDASKAELEKIVRLNNEDELAFLVARSTGDNKAAAEVLKKNDKIEPNPNDLLTLERNGIDVSFLSAFDPTLDIADSAEVAECLAQLAVLVPQLAKLQDARLVAPNRPPELMPQLDEAELRTASQVRRGLATALKKLEPGVAYDTNALRQALIGNSK